MVSRPISSLLVFLSLSVQLGQGLHAGRLGALDGPAMPAKEEEDEDVIETPDSEAPAEEDAEAAWQRQYGKQATSTASTMATALSQAASLARGVASNTAWRTATTALEENTLAQPNNPMTPEKIQEESLRRIAQFQSQTEAAQRDAKDAEKALSVLQGAAMKPEVARALEPVAKSEAVRQLAQTADRFGEMGDRLLKMGEGQSFVKRDDQKSDQVARMRKGLRTLQTDLATSQGVATGNSPFWERARQLVSDAVTSSATGA